MPDGATPDKLGYHALGASVVSSYAETANLTELTLRLAREQAEIRVVAESQAGREEVTLAKPCTRDEVEELFSSVWLQGKQVVVRGVPGSGADAMKELGTRLFRAVLGGRLSGLCKDTFALADKLGQSLRIRLFTEDPELFEIPWELLFDPSRGDFVALSNKAPLVRSREKGYQNEPLAPLSELRILMLETDAIGGMETDREVELLSRISREFPHIRLEVIRDASIGTIGEALGRGNYNVLHFAGTGHSDRRRGSRIEQGLVLFGNVRSEIALFSANDLLDVLREQPDLRLVVANACHTDWLARRIAKGVPAVVGLRGEVPVPACLAFAEALYRTLAARRSIEEAVTAGRQSMDLESPGRRPWSFVTFFLQRSDGRLWQPQVEATPAPTGRQSRERVRLVRLKALHEANLAAALQRLPAQPSEGLQVTIDDLRKRIDEVTSKLGQLAE